jgi:hypothetical protein
MALTLEVGYFNSFYVKRIAGFDSSGKRIPLPKNNAFGTPTSGSQIGPWISPIVSNEAEDWYIEESRIRGGYNNLSTDYGVKAYLVADEPNQERRSSSLIYSGILNSRTGINQTNQFSVAEEISRTVDPISGSIQKLFAEDTNLLIFQERKVNNALIDKDAIFTAEGAGLTTTGKMVIGQTTPISGEWGIATNPESFAKYGYMKYFVDVNRGAVLRLAGGQITEISNYGMIDFFRDQLSTVLNTGSVLGGYDLHSKVYTLCISPTNRYDSSSSKTLTYDENSKGWTSFFDYKPETIFSSRGDFYSTKSTTSSSLVFEHYSNNVNRNNFYGVNNVSSVQFVFNPSPTAMKTFKTINYEGTSGWEVTSLISDQTQFDETPADSGNWISHVDSILGGGPIIPTSLFGSITTNTTNGVNNTYANVEYISSGGGTGLAMSVTVALSVVTVVTVTNAGDGYVAGEVITLTNTTTGASSIGGTDVVTITLTSADVNQATRIYSYDEGQYAANGVNYRAGFDRKQNKYMAVIPNNTITPMPGEVVFGNSMTGIKAYYATVTMKTDATTDPGGLKELFAVGSVFA